MTTVKKWKPRVSKEWLEREYIEKRRSCPEIGAELGKDSSTIRGWLVSYGIPTRPRGAPTSGHPFIKGEPSAFKGRKHTPEAKELLRQACLADGRVPYLVNGQPYMRGRTGAANPHWQGGLTPERQAFNNSADWKQAARAVWIRDGYHCRRCGCRPPSKGPKHNRGHVHHIVSFQVRELRTVLTNLVLLCADCHRWVHSRANVDRKFIGTADGSAPALFDLLDEAPAASEASLPHRLPSLPLIPGRAHDQSGAGPGWKPTRKGTMSIRNKILAVAATLALVGGVGTAGVLTAGSASAATPSCGIACVSVFSQQFGTHPDPAYVLDTFRQGEKVGQPVILFRQANFDPAEDFTATFQGTVADFFAAGLVSSEVALHYGCTTPAFPVCIAPTQADDPAFEQEYSPFGVESGLCVGLAATAVQGEGVTLQPCGESSRTVWIIDQEDSSTGPVNILLNEYVPLINGSDTDFSNPFVLTYPANGFPTDTPRPQFTVANVTGFSNPSTGDPEGVESNQMFGAVTGTLK